MRLIDSSETPTDGQKQADSGLEWADGRELLITGSSS